MAETTVRLRLCRDGDLDVAPTDDPADLVGIPGSALSDPDQALAVLQHLASKLENDHGSVRGDGIRQEALPEVPQFRRVRPCLGRRADMPHVSD